MKSSFNRDNNYCHYVIQRIAGFAITLYYHPAGLDVIMQDTNISLNTGLQISDEALQPERDQNPPSETREEASNQTINFEMDFTILATKLKEIKLTNMSSSTKEYMWQTAASLENKRNDIL
jgi:hypothetical protein